MAKKIKDKRFSYNITDFYSQKISFEKNVLKFGSEIRVNDIVSLLKLDLNDLNKKLKKEYKLDYLLDDNEIAEIAFQYNIEFEKIDDVSRKNILSKINFLVQNNK